MDGLAVLRDMGRRAGRDLVSASAADRDRLARWDPDLFASLARRGVPGIALPADRGGSAATALEAVALFDGLGEGAGDPGLVLSVAANAFLCGVPIAVLGTAAQRDGLLPGIASGDRIVAVGQDEIIGGTQGVRAVRTPRGWRVSGTVPSVLNAPVARTFLLTAEVYRGTRTAFLLDRNAPGVGVRPGASVTMRTCPTGVLELDDVPVALDNVLGVHGAAADELVPMLAVLDRTLVSAPWLGVLRYLARRVADLAAATRELSGTPSVRLAVAEVRTSVELARELVRRATGEFTEDAEVARPDAAAAKLFLVEAVRRAVDLAVELSDDVDPVVARLHRDAQAFAAASGGTEALWTAIARPRPQPRTPLRRQAS